MKHIIRTELAGVFYGEMADLEQVPSGNIVTIKNCRRLWYWKGANSLSQLAMDGSARPSECKFTVIVPEMRVFNAKEIIPCSEKAESVIDAVPVWKY